MQEILRSIHSEHLRLLRVLHFSPDLDIYTLSFNETGTRKKTEKQMTTTQVLELLGGPEAIQNYRLSSAKKSKLCAFNFNPDLDSYTLSFLEEGQKLEKLMTTAHILELPGGLEAIEKYKKLELDRYNSTQPKIISAFNFNLLLDNYTVKIQSPGETYLIEKQMTTTEILSLPSGASAIASYNRLSHLVVMNAQATTITPARNLSILKFDKVLKNYTVSYTDPGKRARSKKTEQMLTRSELTNMQGVLLVLLIYLFLLSFNTFYFFG